MEDKEELLNERDLQKLSITPELAKQAYEQTRDRAESCLSTHERLQQRATFLLRYFSTLAIAIFGYGIGIERLTEATDPNVEPYALLAAPLVFAAALMFIAIRDRKFGTLGGSPSWWLRKGIIDGSKAEADYLYACLAVSYSRRIAMSTRSNRKTVLWINNGIYLSTLTPIILFGSYLPCFPNLF
tara:strand:+ start:156 stop:710 length:555 start_codon:yes stop_codon:yes gene_type:complete